MYKDDLNIETYDPSLCPYCGSGNVDTLYNEDDCVQRHCHDCDGDFVLWYDEPYDQMPIEVTDRHNLPLF